MYNHVRDLGSGEQMYMSVDVNDPFIYFFIFLFFYSFPVGRYFLYMSVDVNDLGSAAAT